MKTIVSRSEAADTYLLKQIMYSAIAVAAVIPENDAMEFFDRHIHISALRRKSILSKSENQGSILKFPSK